MPKRYPPIGTKWSYRQIGRFLKISKSQASKEVKEMEGRIKNNDEDFIFDLSCILLNLSTLAKEKKELLEAEKMENGQ